MDHGDYLSLEFSQSLFIDDDEPSRYVREISGVVSASIPDDSEVGFRQEDAGKFSVFIVDVESAVNDRESIFEIFDWSSRTIDYFDLYENGLEFKPKVLKAMGGETRWAPNILILDRLELLPQYRRRENGLRTLRWMQHQFGAGCGIVAMKPFPLQFEGGPPEEKSEDPDFIRLRLDEYDSNYERALRKLRSHYARLGFGQVPGTPYMVADPYRPMVSLEPKKARGRA